jgi:hypothetical protein
VNNGEEMLKKTKLWAFALMLLAIPGMQTNAQDPPAFPPESGGHSTSLPSTSVTFGDRRNRGATEKLTIFDVYGDGRTGRHGSFAKFTAGFVSRLHTHTYDYYGVVIKGEIENHEVGVPPIKMGPGSYWYQEGHVPHITACVSKDDCLTYIVQSGKFDVQHPDTTK